MVDEVFGMVVIAFDEKEARQLARENGADEGGDTWLDSKLTSCICIGKSLLKKQVVLRDITEG